MQANSEIRIHTYSAELTGNLEIPPNPAGIVLFAHGSGSSRLSSRNRFVAAQLNKAGLATLLFDLLTEEEEIVDNETRRLRFDIDLLAKRVTGAVDYVSTFEQTKNLKIGLFGASTGAAASLIAACHRPAIVKAIVSRGGRPDLAKYCLEEVQTPTLFIVGGLDTMVLGLNQQAHDLLAADRKQLEVVEGASHLFEEPGKLETVAKLAGEWFGKELS